MIWILLGVALATALVYAWKYTSKINKYFEERGIPHEKPLPFFGNSLNMFMRKISFNEQHKKYYQMFPNEKFYGYFDTMKPYLVVKDLEHVERVLIKDFQHFTDHGFMDLDEASNPIDINLFNMQGKSWKAFRNKLSPLFTTGKLRGMVPQIKDLSDSLVKLLDRSPTEVDIRDCVQRFAMDVIASCAFGITINAIEDKGESEFREMGKKAFRFTFSAFLRFFILSAFPKLAKKLKLSNNNPEVAKYFSGVIKETMTHRKTTGMKRNDFVQLFVTLQEKGYVEFDGDVDDEYLKTEMTADEKKTELLELTDDVMVGNAFIFLVAGFEGTTAATMYLLYELAINPDIKERLQKEVTRVVDARGGILDYDSIKHMPYLDQCVKETMRLHTFSAALFRKCTKDYTFPGTSVSIKAGESLLIPAIGIHNDPNIYPEPDQFQPERFSSDVTRANCSWLPFGDGPRVCIAMRFALTEIKVAIARIVLEFDFKLNPKTVLPLTDDVATFSAPKNPILIDFEKRSKAKG